MSNRYPEKNTAPSAGATEIPAEKVVQSIAETLDTWHLQLGRQFGPLSRPQRRALRLLASKVSMRVSDLAEQLGLTTAGATRMLDTLEAQGYSTRARVPLTDQREVYVTVTKAGTVALALADAVYFERISLSVARLSLEEQRTLASLLQAMLE
jgi:DNA-binding MarR family transcriptional regulator